MSNRNKCNNYNNCNNCNNYNYNYNENIDSVNYIDKERDNSHSLKLNSSLDDIQSNVLKLSEQISKLKFIDKNNVSNTLIEETENLINEFKKLTANTNNSFKNFIEYDQVKKHIDFIDCCKGRENKEYTNDDYLKEYQTQSVQTEIREIAQDKNIESNLDNKIDNYIDNTSNSNNYNNNSSNNNNNTNIDTINKLSKKECKKETKKSENNFRIKDDTSIDTLFEKVLEISKVPKSKIKKTRIAFKKKGYYTVLSLRLRKKKYLGWSFLFDDFKDVCSQILGISLVIENLLEQEE